MTSALTIEQGRIAARHAYLTSNKALLRKNLYKAMRFKRRWLALPVPYGQVRRSKRQAQNDEIDYILHSTIDDAEAARDRARNPLGRLLNRVFDIDPDYILVEGTRSGLWIALADRKLPREEIRVAEFVRIRIDVAYEARIQWLKTLASS